VAYKNNIPQPGDKKNETQLDLLNNFAAIKTLVDINHETFDITNQGKHLKVDLTNQTAAPPTSAANEVTLYSNAGQLCLSNNGGAEVDVTTATIAATGRCKLPCGLEMKWGSGTLGATVTDVVVPFAAAFTANCFNVQLTTSNRASTEERDWIISAANLTAANFTVLRSSHWNGNIVTFTWLAIGD